MKTAIIYGSTTGATESVANALKESFNESEIFDVSSVNINKVIEEYELIILGSSTWGIGDLQDDWFDKIDELKKIDFTNKTAAFFGTGDQDGYPDSFVNAVGELHDVVKSSGGKIVGYTSTEGYTFDESSAVLDGKFMGLVIDEDNQSEHTDKRVQDWVKQISEEL